MTGRMVYSCLTLLLLSPAAPGKDATPLADHLVWLPMTGITDRQMDDARAAGYDAVLLKIHPVISTDGKRIQSWSQEKVLDKASARGFKLILAILGWRGLGQGQYWDVDESGQRIADRLDPFHPGAMKRVEQYFRMVIDHYKTRGDVIAFAPTWGIYGEAGFTSFTAGRSPHALARFNEWLTRQHLPTVPELPTRDSGPNTAFNRFVRFRYLYLEDRFGDMIRALRTSARPIPVGTWQELYPVDGYLWTMVRVPGADFALYESCFTYQTTHDPERTLAETMGFRYRCGSAADYRDYYLPLLARKRGEGQRFMGCQLSNDYAVKQYGWSQDQADAADFDRWEDLFAPHLRRLLSLDVEPVHRDVLLVFPTYAAAALTPHPCHSVDVKLIDVLLRMFGCQMRRCGSPRLDQLTVSELNTFRLIVVPASAYLMPETLERLKQTTATVLFTGSFGRSFNGELTPQEANLAIDNTVLTYAQRPAGPITVRANHALTQGLKPLIDHLDPRLPADETFGYADGAGDPTILLSCDAFPLLSTRHDDRFIFLHGQLFAGLCHDPGRRPPAPLSGSADVSANEVDTWGPYSSSHRNNALARTIMRNILNHSGVELRVPDPEPRTTTPFLGDHMETASISGNIAYNNTGQPRSLTLRLPYAPAGLDARRVEGRFETRITIPPFGYVVIQPPTAANESR